MSNSKRNAPQSSDEGPAGSSHSTSTGHAVRVPTEDELRIAYEERAGTMGYTRGYTTDLYEGETGSSKYQRRAESAGVPAQAAQHEDAVHAPEGITQDGVQQRIDEVSKWAVAQSLYGSVANLLLAVAIGRPDDVMREIEELQEDEKDGYCEEGLTQIENL